MLVFMIALNSSVRGKSVQSKGIRINGRKKQYNDVRIYHSIVHTLTTAKISSKYAS